MRAVRMTRWGARPVVAEVPRPQPRGEEVLVRVEAAGLCRSDLHVIDAPPGLLPYRTPFTLGHEVAGVVAGLGPEAAGPGPGERVVVYGPWGCGRCPRCAVGAENYCDRRESLDAGHTGTGVGLGRDGGLAEYVLVPSGRLLVPTGGLPPEQAAPLSDAGLTSYHAVAGILRSSAEPACVAVIGVGGLGHLAVQILRATTSARVLAVDTREAALALASECGAHVAVRSAADTAEVLRRHAGGRGVDAVLDFVGTDSTLGLAVRVLRAGGELAVVGSGGGRLTVRKPGALPPGLRISLPFWGTRPELAEVLALARTGALRVDTQRVSLPDVPAALDRLRSGEVRGRVVAVAETPP